MGLKIDISGNGLVQWGCRFALLSLVWAHTNSRAETPGVNREPAVVSGDSAESESQGGKFSPLDCAYPRNLFTGSDWKTQERNYSRANSEVDKCKGGIAFVYPVGDGNDWKVICSRESRGEYVMSIPEKVRNSGKRLTVYNKTGRGSLFALDQLPTTTKEAGSAAYFSMVCTEKATVTFEISVCKTLSFNPDDYGSKKTAQAFLVAEAAEDCDKIAKKTDVQDSQKRLINRKVLAPLQQCNHQ
jgi:hypothetical protein